MRMRRKWETRGTSVAESKSMWGETTPEPEGLLQEGRIYLGTSRNSDDTRNKGEYLELKLANRHGLVTGATGTGKTVSLQILAEGFSAAGVPVFCADVKGDLAGLAMAGEEKDFLEKRAADIGLADYEYDRFPCILWDLYGDSGHPIRTTITEMGPLLLSRLMDLTNAQEGALNIAFKIADEEGFALLDLKDLQAMLQWMYDNSRELSAEYGNISKASVGAIQRSLLVLEQQGADHFFGEPALDIADLMKTTPDGRGAINILAADQLMMAPRLYATFLLWLLSELFEELPEVGNPDKPKLVFFFDEAHLLFDDAPKILVDRVEQVVKLIRSKGVGVYFVTQNPLDVPDGVLAQLGNRIQHALRAYTPRERKAVKTAAETFRPNPDFDAMETITTLGIGEALVSTLETKGVPSIVQRTLIRPPQSRLGTITKAERREVIETSPVHGRYEKVRDRESAFEILKERAEAKAKAEEEEREREDREKAKRKGSRARSRTGRTRRRGRQSVAETAVKSAARSVASSLGRALVRGLLGGLKRGF